MLNDKLNDKKWILIIEDEAEISSGIARLFDKEGFRTLQCDSAKDASVKLENQQFDCIILDLHLKQGDGVGIIEMIQNDPRLLGQATPIVVISGYLDAKVIKDLRGKIAGALVKPFIPATLTEKVKELINMRKSKSLLDPTSN